MESLTASPDLQPSSLRKASQRFLKSISARVGLGLTVAIILLALLAPVLRPFDSRYSTRLYGAVESAQRGALVGNRRARARFADAGLVRDANFAVD